MRKSERIGAIIKILSDNPERSFSLRNFAELLGVSKSTASEDVQSAKRAVAECDLGRIITTPGAAGGVRYVPYISDDKVREIQEELCEKLRDPQRMTGGGFLYTSDIMFSYEMTRKMGLVLARKYSSQKPDYVVTLETKGIPLAMQVAGLLNRPLTVIRRETKVSEGATVAINYYSTASGRMQKMSMAKRAITPGSSALLIDDFMRDGGSLKGVVELLREFDVRICGIGVAICSTDFKEQKVEDAQSIVLLRGVDENRQYIDVIPNSRIF